MPHLPRFTEQGFVYHTISATQKRQPLLADPDNAREVLTAISFGRSLGHILVLAYAILPDHLHLLVVPQGDVTLASAMKAIKSFSARRINDRLDRKGPVWQQSFYDRVIRDDDQLQTTVEYIHRNPVEARLSTRPEEYLFSSAHADAEIDLETFFGHSSL